MKVSITLDYTPNEGWYWKCNGNNGSGGPLETPKAALDAALVYQRDVCQQEVLAFCERAAEMTEVANALSKFIGPYYLKS